MRRRAWRSVSTALMFAENVSASVGDEPSAIYCRLAESVEISEDRNSYTFVLRPEAKWHDGTAGDGGRCRLLHDDAEERRPSGHRAADPSSGFGGCCSMRAPCRLVFNGEQSDRAILSAAVSARDLERPSMRPTASPTPRSRRLSPSGPYKVGRFNAGQLRRV